MEKLLTTKDLAIAIGVSESSLRRWTNSGVIATARTPGGHRRIPLSEAIRFIRRTHAVVLKPEILGLQEITFSTQDIPQSLHQFLINGDAAKARGQIISLYLSGLNVYALCDGPIRTAMQRIGELWRHDPQGILIEHRATDICIGAISAIRQLLPETPPTALHALGAAPTGDPYILPTAMAAAVLAEAGWRETNFGPQTPLDLLADAARDRGASLVWLSVSFIADPVKLHQDIRRLAEQLSTIPIPLALGGRCAAEIISAPCPNIQLMQSMADLGAYAQQRIQSAKDPPVPSMSAKN